MNTRVWTTCVATLALLCIGAPPARAALGALAAGLREVMAGNLAAYDRKDVDATMRSIDSRSPDYDSTKQAIAEQFKELDVTAELVDFDYIGHDDEFAVARAKVKTTGKPGTGFTNNVTDAIVIFHQEKGDWKLWDETILGVEIVP